MLNNVCIIYRFDVSRLLLAIYLQKESLPQADRKGTEEILALICKKGASPEPVFINCSCIIAFISLRLNDFRTIEPVLRVIFQSSDNEKVIEAVAVTIYNVTCSPDNINLLVDNENYLNTMIRLIRVAKPEVHTYICIHQSIFNLILMLSIF